MSSNVVNPRLFGNIYWLHACAVQSERNKKSDPSLAPLDSSRGLITGLNSWSTLRNMSAWGKILFAIYVKGKC